MEEGWKAKFFSERTFKSDMSYLNHRISFFLAFWALLKSRFANRHCLHCRLKEQTSKLQCPLRAILCKTLQPIPICQPSVPGTDSKEQCWCTRRAVFCTPCGKWRKHGTRQDSQLGLTQGWSDNSVTIKSHHYSKGFSLLLSQFHLFMELAHLTSPPNNMEVDL